MRFHSKRRISLLSALAAVLIVGDVAQAQVVEPPGNNFRWVGHDNTYDGVFATSSWIVDEGPGGVPGPSDAAFFTILEAYTILCANELTWGTVIEKSGVTFSGAYNTGLVNVGGSGALIIPPETKFKAENVVVGVDSGVGSIEVNGQLEVSSVKMTIGAADEGSVDVKGPEGFYIADEAPTFVGYDSSGFFRVEQGGACTASLRYRPRRRRRGRRQSGGVWLHASCGRRLAMGI